MYLYVYVYMYICMNENIYDTCMLIYLCKYVYMNVFTVVRIPILVIVEGIVIDLKEMSK